MEVSLKKTLLLRNVKKKSNAEEEFHEYIDVLKAHIVN